VNEYAALAEQFEAYRGHLQAVAYRMLGSLSEAEDAVQESWLHLVRAETSDVKNMGGWLTTIVARVCLDILRTRKARREESLEADEEAHGPTTRREGTIDPEQEAILADSVGLAMLVVLDTLNPAERIAFVLHDLFDVSFNEIAPIVERTTTATRQLASRARRRVQGTGMTKSPDLARSRTVVEAFLMAARAGNFNALITILDPDVVFRPDLTAALPGPTREIHTAQRVAKLFKGGAEAARAALIDGNVGVLVAPLGHLFLALKLTLTNGKITEINVVANPAQLHQLDLAVLGD